MHYVVRATVVGNEWLSCHIRNTYPTWDVTPTVSVADAERNIEILLPQKNMPQVIVFEDVFREKEPITETYLGVVKECLTRGCETYFCGEPQYIKKMITELEKNPPSVSSEFEENFNDETFWKTRVGTFDLNEGGTFITPNGVKYFYMKKQ